VAKNKAQVQSLEELPVVLSVAEAANVLRISHTTAYELVHRWMATGGAEGIPVVQFGRVLRVPRAALSRLLAVQHGSERSVPETMDDGAA
jgi:excisionase family DNA binding protein